MKSNQPFCHSLIKKTAQGLSARLYEHMAKNSNAFFKKWPKPGPFIEATWGDFVEDARTTLVDMLTTNIPEALKEEIADAIVKDNTLTRGREARLASRLRTGQSGRLQVH